ncbi:MAG TPA: glycosyltransferase family 39 protein, partial [Candidatus Xenobia bacterium]
MSTRQTLGLIVLAAAALRLFHLAWHPLWLDEAHMVIVASLDGWLKVLEFVGDFEQHPPLYYLFIHAIYQYWASPFMLRLPSALFSIVSVAALYALGRAVASPRVGLWSAAMLAFCAYELPFAQEIRMYPMLMALLLATAICFVRWTRGLGGRWLAAAVLAGLGAVYVDYRALLVVAALAVYGLPFYRRRWRAVVAAAAVFTLGTLPALQMMQAQAEFGGWFVSRFFGAPDLPTVMRSISAMGVSAVLQFPVAWHEAIGIALLGLIAAGIGGSPKRWEASLGLWVLLLGESVMVGYSVLRFHIFCVHHMIFVLPFVLLAVAQGVDVIWLRWRPVAGVLAVAWLAINGYAMAQWDFNPQANWQDFRAVAAWLQPQLVPGDVIVVVPAYMQYPFRYYYDGTIPVLGLQPGNFG